MKFLRAFFVPLAFLLLSAGPVLAGTVTLKVGGMTCRLCEGAVKKTLQSAKGVKSASVSYKEGQAVVVYNEDETGPAEFLKALKKAGYTGSVAEK